VAVLYCGGLEWQKKREGKEDHWCALGACGNVFIWPLEKKKVTKRKRVGRFSICLYESTPPSRPFLLLLHQLSSFCFPLLSYPKHCCVSHPCVCVCVFVVWDKYYREYRRRSSSLAQRFSFRSLCAQGPTPPSPRSRTRQQSKYLLFFFTQSLLKTKTSGKKRVTFVAVVLLACGGVRF
jgi:hypothetical protein